MEMDIRATNPNEKLYLYSQNGSMNSYSGCIGCLRGDFNKSGEEFFSTWTDRRGDLKTDEFR